MDVRTCKSCGRLFNYLSGEPLCSACRDVNEKKFVEVKEYIREHRNAPIKQVSEECEVSIKQLERWVRQERLEFSKDSGVMFYCSSCGEPIQSGTMCEKCKNSMASTLSGLINKPKAPEVHKKQHESDKMRFLKK
jgi:hypothetical protein